MSFKEVNPFDEHSWGHEFYEKAQLDTLKLAEERGWLKHNWLCQQWARDSNREIYLNEKEPCTCGLYETLKELEGE